MNRKIKDALTLGIAAAFVLMFALWGICKSDDAVSESERRPLKQFPTLNAEEVLSGRFQLNFESYTLDQFPLRDSFRRLKAVTLLDVLREPLPVPVSLSPSLSVHRTKKESMSPYILHWQLH